ncbi:MAG: CvpA family protein [Pseudomonadota bacterium]
MEGFTIIDGVVALVIVLSGLLAYSRGFVREGLAIAGWIVAAILAFMFAPTVRPMVEEIPYVGDFIRESCDLGMIAAFFAVLAVALIVASLITPLFSSVIQRSFLGGIDQGLGFLFGVARGILLVAVAYFVYDTVVAAQNIQVIDDSRSARIFASLTGSVEDQDPEAAVGWVQSKVDQLLGHCDAH